MRPSGTCWHQVALAGTNHGFRFFGYGLRKLRKLRKFCGAPVWVKLNETGHMGLQGVIRGKLVRTTVSDHAAP
jgi:hypothetical protein